MGCCDGHGEGDITLYGVTQAPDGHRPPLPCVSDWSGKSNEQRSTTHTEQKAHGMTGGEERIVPVHPSIRSGYSICPGFPMRKSVLRSREKIDQTHGECWSPSGVGKATTSPQPVALQYLQEECTDSKAVNGRCWVQ